MAKKSQEIQNASRTRIVDVAEWVSIRVSNIDELRDAIETSAQTQRELAVQTQQLVAQMERGGVVKRSMRAVGRLWERVRERVRDLVRGWGNE